MLAKKFKLPVGSFPRQSEVILDDERLTLRGVTNNLTHSRVGIVFKKGAFKTATLRNSIKRRVFNFFRENWAGFDTKGVDLLVTVKPAIITLTNQEIGNYLKTHVNLQRNITPPSRKRPGSHI